jgi:hypothetical protein
MVIGTTILDLGINCLVLIPWQSLGAVHEYTAIHQGCGIQIQHLQLAKKFPVVLHLKCLLQIVIVQITIIQLNQFASAPVLQDIFLRRVQINRLNVDQRAGGLQQITSPLAFHA